MNVFKQEFNMKIKSIIIWSLSLAGFMVFYMAFFPSIGYDSQILDSIMDSFPEEMMQALGIRDGLSIGTLVGYFTLTFTLVQLGLAIQSAHYGISILTQEDRELTADFLMSKPISRRNIYFSKLFSAILSLLITAIIVGIGSFMALELFNGGEAYKADYVIKLLLIVPIFQLLFLSIGMFVSLLFKKVRNVLSLSMGLAIGMYVINSVRGIVDSDILGYITPYYYFEPGTILQSGKYDLKLFLIGIGVIVLSLMGSYLIYNKRDIHSL